MGLSLKSDLSRRFEPVRCHIGASSANASLGAKATARPLPVLFQGMPAKDSKLLAHPPEIQGAVLLAGAGSNARVTPGLRLEHPRPDSLPPAGVSPGAAGLNEIVAGHGVRVSFTGGGQPPHVLLPASGGSNDDFSHISRYADALLGEKAVLLDDRQLRGIMALRTDARYQHAISAQAAGATLRASGSSFTRFLAQEDIARAEWQLISALRTNVAQLPRIALSSKETIEEALKVFNDAHARFSRDEKLPDELQIIAHYLEPDFPEGTDRETKASVARAIVDIPHSTAMRRIGHLVRLAACLEKADGPSLEQLLLLSPLEAEEVAWRQLRATDQGGAAAMETFWDWYSRYADAGETTRPAALKPLLDPDSFAERKAEQFAADAFRRSFTEILEAALRQYGRAERDELTHFYQARNLGFLDGLVSNAASHVDQLGGRVWYVELDIINMGGLNKHFKDVHALADPHIKRICHIFLDVLSRYSAQIVPFRIAGDEFGFIVVGCDEGTLRAMLSEVNERVADYVQTTDIGDSKKLADLKKAKTDGQDGFGAHYGYARVRSKSTAKSVRGVAALMINRSKQGMPPMLGS